MTDRALCVGINEFVNLSPSSTLYGCVNDAHDMAAMLRGRGFADESVTVLTDSAATKANVLGTLTTMVQESRSGDHLVFSLSSHGTQIPDTDGDEPDQADECFACYDIAQAGHRWDPDTVIVDDELRKLFATLAHGVLVEVFLDTCHSGSGLRDLDLLSGRRPRFLPPPTARGLGAVNRATRRTTMTSITGEAPAASRPVLYAACRPDQTSSDATFDARSSGAFTYYLLKALAADPARTRKEVLGEVTTGLRAGDFTQRPTLEGPTKARAVPVGQRW